MMRAFRFEWTKLWRLRHALAVWGVMVGIACLFGALFFGTAGDEARAPGPGRPASFLTVADLERPEGLSTPLRVSAQVLLVVAFTHAAGSMANEYGQGTLKMLLAREPRRLRALAGKSAALLAHSALGVALAALAQVATIAAVAAGRGIDTGAWWTAGNVADAGLLLLRLLGAVGAWGLLGVMLAVLLRSAPAAIGIGIGYTIVVEGVLGLVLDEAHRYLPGQALQSFVSAGQAPIGQAAPEPLGLAASAALGGAYALAFAAVAAAVFRRRDVTQ